MFVTRSRRPGRPAPDLLVAHAADLDRAGRRALVIWQIGEARRRRRLKGLR
ncbi:hypothetical protein [Kitasatospora sp. NPDC006786]|uniref:hypothetical protein n=1 Tax=unclassified Kitasatospora TaxID=2633591 RepID=UPI0033ED7DED